MIEMTCKKDVLFISPHEIKPKESQARKTFNGIEELAASIVQEGQIQPIIVSAKSKDGFYVLQKGERRWRACLHANIPYVEAIVETRKQGHLDELAGELIENIQREALSPLEIANALNYFLKAGWKQKSIAQRLGKNYSFVSSHLSLLRLDSCILQLCNANVTQDTETLNNLRLLFELDQEVCRKLCKKALVTGVTRKQTRGWLNSFKQAGNSAPHKEQLIVDREIAPSALAGVPELSIAGSSAAADRDEVEQLAASVAAVSPPKTVILPAVSSNFAQKEQPELLACAASGYPSLHKLATEAVANTVGTVEIENLKLPLEFIASEKLEQSTADNDGTNANRGINELLASDVILEVNVLYENDFQRAVVLWHKIDDMEGYLWVRPLQPGMNEAKRVNVSDIEIVSLRLAARSKANR